METGKLAEYSSSLVLNMKVREMANNVMNVILKNLMFLVSVLTKIIKSMSLLFSSIKYFTLLPIFIFFLKSFAIPGGDLSSSFFFPKVVVSRILFFIKWQLNHLCFDCFSSNFNKDFRFNRTVLFRNISKSNCNFHRRRHCS